MTPNWYKDDKFIKSYFVFYSYKTKLQVEFHKNS